MEGPPGFVTKQAEVDGPPPGFDGTATAEEVADLAKEVQKVEVSSDVDKPDPSLKTYEGLQESAEQEIKTVTHGNEIYQSAATFDELGLSPELLQGIYLEMKFERPSKVQAKTLPMILTPPYRDLIAQAHNGSGKTTCFVLSMLSRVNPSLREPQALCACPTRELVIQNLMVLNKMAKYTTIKAVSTAGDEYQYAAGARPSRITEHVVIGTHGRLKHWTSKKMLDLDNIQILVFDEADEMLKEDGFADDSVRMIKTIRKKNPRVQLLLFSATFNERVKAFALKIAPTANQVFIPKEELSLDVIKQYNVKCPTRPDKIKVLQEMIFPNCDKLGQTIIFVRSKDMSRQLHQTMQAAGYKCTSIQGDMEHEQRDRVVNEFRSGTTKVLIATDVLSRGFDVSQVTLVVNFDVPTERDQRTPSFETYLHRIGRSGRFGRKGAAFNFITGPEEQRQVETIASYFNRYIPEVPYNDEDAFLEVLKQAGLADQ